MMNYIELLNTFWALNKEYSFTPNEKALYFAILNKCNELGWKNPFNQSNGYLAMDSGMSESAMQKARNTLQQKGLISFASGDGRRNNTVYTVNVVNAQKGNTKGNFKNNLYGTLSDTLYGTLSDTLSHENSTDNNKPKTKLNETKLEREPVSPVPTDPGLATPVKERKKRIREPFVPPTREEMRGYFQKIIGGKWGDARAKFSADVCYDHYKGNGWIQGKNKPIVDWNAAANNWVRREMNGEFTAAPPSQNPTPPPAPAPKPVPKPPDPPPLSEEEKKLRNNEYINDLYSDFLAGELRTEFMSASAYDHLKACCKISLDEQSSRRIKAEASTRRLLQLSESKDESDKALAELYRNKPDSQQVKDDGPVVLRMAKNIALLEFFESCKAQNLKTIF